MAFDAFVYIEGASSSGLKVEGETSDKKYSKVSNKAFEIQSF